MKVKDMRKALEHVDGELELYFEEDYAERLQTPEVVQLARVDDEERQTQSGNFTWTEVVLLRDEDFELLPVTDDEGRLAVVLMLIDPNAD